HRGSWQERAHRERIDQAVIERLGAHGIGDGHRSRSVALRLWQHDGLKVGAKALLRGPGDEAPGVNGAAEDGVGVAAPWAARGASRRPWGVRGGKGRAAVGFPRAAWSPAAVRPVWNSPASTAKRSTTMKTASKMTARTIRRRKASPAALVAAQS